MWGRYSATANWIGVHLVYPLTPVVIEGGIRWLASDKTLTYDTFSASTLALSVALLSMFVNQSVVRSGNAVLADKAEDDTRQMICMLFILLALGFFGLFMLLVLLYTLVNDRHQAALTTVHQSFQAFVFMFSVVPVVFAVATQRGLKLRASLL